MQKRENDMELQEDKLSTEALFNKEELDRWEASNKAVPHNYFNAFEANTIHSVQNLPPTRSIFQLSTWKTLAVAASFLAITSSAYLWMELKPADNNSTAALNIQQISTEEINAYLNANDWLADVDWQTELSKEDLANPSLNTLIKNDSN
jgi:hypothetical protein